MTVIRPEHGPPAERPDEGTQPTWHPRRPPPVWQWPPIQRILPENAGAVLAVVLLVAPCCWPLTGTYYLVRSARLVAWWLFRVERSTTRGHDRAITRIKRLRAWTAPVVSLALFAGSGAFSYAGDDLMERWTLVFVAPWLFVASAPVVTAGLIGFAAPHRRAGMRRGLRGPLRKLGRYGGTLALLYCFIGAAIWASVSWSGWMFLVVIWSMLLFSFASITFLQTGLGLEDVHPTLPPLLTTVLVWELAALSGVPEGPPPMVGYVLLAGGPAVMTAIAGWEMHRLRTWYGVTLRGE